MNERGERKEIQVIEKKHHLLDQAMYYIIFIAKPSLYVSYLTDNHVQDIGSLVPSRVKPMT